MLESSMGKHFGFLLILFFLSFSAYSQDERHIREIIQGPREKLTITPDWSWVHQGPMHAIDLTGDGEKEYFQTQKRDGQDWIVVYSSNFVVLFQEHLQAWGTGSYLYRFRLLPLSSTMNLMLLYFYEGVTEALDHEGSSRVYFLTWNKSDSKSYNLFQGPRILTEKQIMQAHPSRFHYHVTAREIDVVDYDKDGVNEVRIYSGSRGDVYRYTTLGIWKKY